MEDDESQKSLCYPCRSQICKRMGAMQSGAIGPSVGVVFAQCKIQQNVKSRTVVVSEVVASTIISCKLAMN